MRSTMVATLLCIPALAAASDAPIGPPGPVRWCNERFSRFLAGTYDEYAGHVAVDAASNVYVAGNTNSPDFPVTSGAFDTSFNGGFDTWVVKLGPTGSIVYATFLGGPQWELPDGIAVDGSGAAYVTGWTESPAFPVTPGAFDTTYGGSEDAFVTKVSSAGDALVYSTFVGGSGDDGFFDVVVDAAGRATLAGYSSSVDYPTTTGAYDRAKAGRYDAVVTTLAPSGGALGYSTYIGGSDDEGAWCLAVDAGGNAYVAGTTWSTDYPVTQGVVQPVRGGGAWDGFVTKLDASGATLGYSTYLGGSVTESFYAITVDAAGAAFVAGATLSADFPVTAGAYDPTYNGDDDVVVAKLTPSAGALAYSTFLGGSLEEGAYSVALDGQGRLHVVGATSSTDFPVVLPACQPQYAGSRDGYMVLLSNAGDALVTSTFLGRATFDGVGGVALDQAGRRHVVGGHTFQSSNVFVMAFP